MLADAETFWSETDLLINNDCTSIGALNFWLPCDNLNDFNLITDLETLPIMEHNPTLTPSPNLLCRVLTLLQLANLTLPNHLSMPPDPDMKCIPAHASSDNLQDSCNLDDTQSIKSAFLTLGTP